jgi:predicted MFS family arabinose efflux permease
MAAFDLFSFYLPLHARGAGLSATAIGIVLSFFGAAAIVVRFALPALVARFGDERLLSACLLLSAIAYAVMPMCRDLVGLCLLSFAIGLTLGCCPALLVPMTYARAPEGRSGEALGLRLAASYGAHTAVPSVFGGLSTYLGMAAIF